MLRSKQVILLVFLLITCSGCESDSVFDDLEKAQQNFEQDARENNISRWSIDVMFPDKQVQLLAKAAGEGEIEAVQNLVAQGVDVNYRGKNGIVPLAWTLREKNLEGFTALLELGADPNAIWSKGSYISLMGWSTDLARDPKKQIFLETLLQFGGNPNLITGDTPPIFMLVVYSPKKGDINAINILFDAGADINFQSNSENTPLHKAYFSAIGTHGVNFKIVKELIKLGANPNVQNHSNKSVIDYLLRDEKQYAELVDHPGLSSRQAKQAKETFQGITDLINWMENRGIRVKS